MAVLEMGNAWWSVAGLFVDATGFGLLAWDLLPDFWKQTKIRTLNLCLNYWITKENWLRGNQREAATENGAVPYPKPRYIGDVEFEYLGNDKDDELIIELTAACCARDRSSVHNLVTEFKSLGGNPSAHIDHIKVYRSRLVKNLLDVNQWRPPIPLGVVLIILGFLMQAWGSIPVASTAPITVGIESQGAVTITWD